MSAPEPDRFAPTRNSMEPAEAGGWVLYADYAALNEAVRDYLAAKDGYFGHVGNTGPATIAEMNAAESRLRSLASPTPNSDSTRSTLGDTE